MGDEAVMLAAVLVPCLVAILVVAKLLYCAFYRDWMGRCLHSASRATSGKPSGQRSQRQGQDDSRNDNENDDDVEALRDQGYPSVVFSHGRPIQPVGLR